MMNKRQSILTILAFVGLVSLAFWSFMNLRSSHLAATDAAERLSRMRQIATRIEQVRARPVLASSEKRTVADIAFQVEQAMTAVGIRPEQVLSITPQPSRRVEETAYERQDTVLQLVDVKLQNLVKFLYQVRQSDGTELSVKSLNISAPRQQEDSKKEELWNAEVTLTALVFSRKNPPAAPGQ